MRPRLRGAMFARARGWNWRSVTGEAAILRDPGSTGTTTRQRLSSGGCILDKTPLPRYPAQPYFRLAWRPGSSTRPPPPAKAPQATRSVSARAQATTVKFAGCPITGLTSRSSRSEAGSPSMVTTVPSLALPWWATRRSASKHPYSSTTGRPWCAPHHSAQHVLSPAPPPL